MTFFAFVCFNLKVLKAVVSWLHHKPSSRLHHAAALVKKVRLGLISAQDLDDLMDSKILSIPQCKSVFDQLIKHIALNSPICGQLVNKHPEFFSARVSTKVRFLPLVVEIETCVIQDPDPSPGIVSSRV